MASMSTGFLHPECPAVLLSLHFMYGEDVIAIHSDRIDSVSYASTCDSIAAVLFQCWVLKLRSRCFGRWKLPGKIVLLQY